MGKIADLEEELAFVQNEYADLQLHAARQKGGYMKRIKDLQNALDYVKHQSECDRQKIVAEADRIHSKASLRRENLEQENKALRHNLKAAAATADDLSCAASFAEHRFVLATKEIADLKAETKAWLFGLVFTTVGGFWLGFLIAEMRLV